MEINILVVTGSAVRGNAYASLATLADASAFGNPGGVARHARPTKPRIQNTTLPAGPLA
ncbi:hypothetical protein [Luteococcus peritonei]|uniref:NADPH-dependent FMN reductase-like domain-containing protein n=1 Tax=Luteococcus peritonei TaxID=88874 RepID=A0ABW4RX13_9ACTN